MLIKTTWTNNNQNTIANKLNEKLGREATNKELCEEVKRILREAV